MGRTHGKKSLYEVMGKSALKPKYDKVLTQQQTPAAEDSVTGTQSPYTWPKKARIVQFNANSIDVSMPYPIAIAILLGVVLFGLILFRLGQFSYQQKNAELAGAISETGQQTELPAMEQKTQPPEVTLNAEVIKEAGPAKLLGNNNIVIQTFRTSRDLVPAKQFFAENGIATEIIQYRGTYYLRTKSKYENPAKAGSDGFYELKKIVELGAEYKSPLGYETFGKKPFHDAYGMRFDN